MATRRWAVVGAAEMLGREVVDVHVERQRVLARPRAAVVRSLGADLERIRPTTSDASVRPAPRPAWSVLGHDRLHGVGVEPVGA